MKVLDPPLARVCNACNDEGNTKEEIKIEKQNRIKFFESFEIKLKRSRVWKRVPASISCLAFELCQQGFKNWLKEMIVKSLSAKADKPADRHNLKFKVHKVIKIRD